MLLLGELICLVPQWIQMGSMSSEHLVFIKKMQWIAAIYYLKHHASQCLCGPSAFWIGAICTGSNHPEVPVGLGILFYQNWYILASLILPGCFAVAKHIFKKMCQCKYLQPSTVISYGSNVKVTYLRRSCGLWAEVQVCSHTRSQSPCLCRCESIRRC